MKAFLSLKDIKQRNNYLRTHLAKRCTQSIQVNHSRKWQPPLVFLPGKVHRHRSLPGYSPWGPKELEAIERTGRHTHTVSGTWTLETQFRGEGLRPWVFPLFTIQSAWCLCNREQQKKFWRLFVLLTFSHKSENPLFISFGSQKQILK